MARERTAAATIETAKLAEGVRSMPRNGSWYSVRMLFEFCHALNFSDRPCISSLQTGLLTAYLVSREVTDALQADCVSPSHGDWKFRLTGGSPARPGSAAAMDDPPRKIKTLIKQEPALQIPYGAASESASANQHAADADQPAEQHSPGGKP